MVDLYQWDGVIRHKPEHEPEPMEPYDVFDPLDWPEGSIMRHTALEYQLGLLYAEDQS